MSSSRVCPRPTVVNQLAPNRLFGRGAGHGLAHLARPSARQRRRVARRHGRRGRTRGAPPGEIPHRPGHHCLGGPIAGIAGHGDRHDRDFWLTIGRWGVGRATPAQLAHGISVALYNTAFGLIVAIPALIFWRYFRSRADAYLLTWSWPPSSWCATCSAAPCQAKPSRRSAP